MSWKMIIKAYLWVNFCSTIGIVIGHILVPESLLFASIWWLYIAVNIGATVGIFAGKSEIEDELK